MLFNTAFKNTWLTYLNDCWFGAATIDTLARLPGEEIPRNNACESLHNVQACYNPKNICYASSNRHRGAMHQAAPRFNDGVMANVTATMHDQGIDLDEEARALLCTIDVQRDQNNLRNTSIEGKKARNIAKSNKKRMHKEVVACEAGGHASGSGVSGSSTLEKKKTKSASVTAPTYHD